VVTLLDVGVTRVWWEMKTYDDIPKLRELRVPDIGSGIRHPT